MNKAMADRKRRNNTLANRSNDLATELSSDSPAIITTRNRQICVLVFSVLLAIFSALAFSSSIQKSPTADEPVHLFGGYSYLKWGDYRVNPEHPSLASRQKTNALRHYEQSLELMRSSERPDDRRD